MISIPTKVASYSFSLLDAGKFSSIDDSIFSPVGAFSCKPTQYPFGERLRPY